MYSSVGAENVNQELYNVNNKIERGMHNSLMARQQKVSRTREFGSTKPDLEEIYKANEDQKFGAWEKYLIKQRDKQKLLKKFQKEKEKKLYEKGAFENEKLQKVKENIVNNNRETKDKNSDLNDKIKKMQDQIDKNEERRTIRSLKQREKENLRHLDNEENMGVIKNQRFLENCQIVEKHLALSILNQEKKQFLMSFNDKYRSKMAKEKIINRAVTNNASPYIQATQKHMNLSTYAPDMVKWTRKDIAKLLKADKKED